ncbi:hypothetical protein AAW51_2131 [Caldimonas brevitalea]|uniref:Uncharacterized protein n=2 Tax=Caldimonas brevitalea TaxID=413882 RepID=A0A0G3BHK9_9BURK|nr:hypothetical protein AAW51_2131 [Caldimonas brevitalea]
MFPSLRDHFRDAVEILLDMSNADTPEEQTQRVQAALNDVGANRKYRIKLCSVRHGVVFLSEPLRWRNDTLLEGDFGLGYGYIYFRPIGPFPAFTTYSSLGTYRHPTHPEVLAGTHPVGWSGAQRTNVTRIAMRNIGFNGAELSPGVSGTTLAERKTLLNDDWPYLLDMDGMSLVYLENISVVGDMANGSTKRVFNGIRTGLMDCFRARNLKMMEIAGKYFHLGCGNSGEILFDGCNFESVPNDEGALGGVIDGHTTGGLERSMQYAGGPSVSFVGTTQFERAGTIYINSGGVLMQGVAGAGTSLVLGPKSTNCHIDERCSFGTILNLGMGNKVGRFYDTDGSAALFPAPASDPVNSVSVPGQPGQEWLLRTQWCHNTTHNELTTDYKDSFISYWADNGGTPTRLHTSQTVDLKPNGDDTEAIKRDRSTHTQLVRVPTGSTRVMVRGGDPATLHGGLILNVAAWPSHLRNGQFSGLTGGQTYTGSHVSNWTLWSGTSAKYDTTDPECPVLLLNWASGPGEIGQPLRGQVGKTYKILALVKGDLKLAIGTIADGRVGFKLLMEQGNELACYKPGLKLIELEYRFRAGFQGARLSIGNVKAPAADSAGVAWVAMIDPEAPPTLYTRGAPTATNVVPGTIAKEIAPAAGQPTEWEFTVDNVWKARTTLAA